LKEKVLDEARLVHLAIPTSGWAGERTSLSDGDIMALRNLIRRPILEDAEDFLDASLQQIFAATVESEAFWRHMRLEKASSILCTSYPSSLRMDRNPKLGTVIEAEFLVLRSLYLSCQEDPTKEHVLRLARALSESHDVTRAVIEVCMLELCGYEPSFASGDDASLTEHLPELGRAIEDGSTFISTDLRCGATEPAMEQMARSLASLYLRVTGEFPRRNYRCIPPKRDGTLVGNSGDFIELCRHMAALVNRELPAHLRRPKPVQMAKPAMRMMEELTSEFPNKD
jgi:hypothetical protein